ncbi:MAG: hypothetical protein HYZ45_07130 [Burkholderiales bacterium]|nr:hypothetical protein [Burkholderiales bacterium]
MGSLKRLDIDYSCGGRQQNRVGFEDGNFAQLRCGDNAPVVQVYQPPVQTPGPIHHGSHSGGSIKNGLTVVNARWEVVGGGTWCDATPQLAGACDGRTSCQLPVDPKYLCNGDPAVGRQKRLDIKYLCNGNMQPQIGFLDGSQASLQCGGVAPPVQVPASNQLLQVTFARWEVNGGGPWCDALPQMAAACNGRHFCQVPVDPRNLCSGDPAPGRYKTLEVRYTCRGKPKATMGFPDGSQAALNCE